MIGATEIEHNVGDLWALRSLVAAMIPTLQWRRHGIGALQAYVREDSERELRIHIWCRDLMIPGIAESGNAHNHRFTLRSTLLVGALLHTEWNISEGAGYALYDFVHARLHNDENRTEMRRLPDEVAVTHRQIHLRGGDRYTFARGAYHDSMPKTDIVVTLVEKLDQVEEKARVVAPAHIPPVPAFGGGDPDPALVAILLKQAERLLRSQP